MKRLLLYAATLSAAVSVLITPIAALADKGVISEIGPEIGAVEITVDTRPHRLADNTVTEATGKTWIDADTGERLFEYTARIDSAPEYIGDTRIDCTWHQEAPGQWEAGANLFTATVTNRLTKVKYDDNNLIWSPQVFVGGVEYTCDKEPELLPVDPINENYRNNTLSWDYGVCERRLRLIEGMISEVYIFERDPGADVQIKTNGVKDRGFEGETPVFAYDAAGNSIPISADKVVTAEDLKGAAYPVTIDPTESYVTSASDGFLGSALSVNYPLIQGAATASSLYATLTRLQIGQDSGGILIYRSYVYFDTSALPDGAVITACNLSLYGYPGFDYSTVDFNISIQHGMPTYPHDPLAKADYDKTFYDGNGIGNDGFNTAGWITTGYNNISLNATGLGWIDTTGTTKLCLRSYEDIIASSPVNLEFVSPYAYEKGAGYRPTLYVTYVSSGPPDVSSVAATYVTKTTARVNGYLDSDGGEAATVWFNYWEWYNANWSDCIEFSINASYVDADLTNFPVLVTGSQLNTTDTDFWTTVDANGSDILFTSSNGVTKLNRELVSINRTAMTMECYVNVTSIDDTTDTKFYMYYGANVSLHNESNSTATWDVNYVFVSHMNDNPNTSTIQDSTVYNNDGFKDFAANPLEISGLVGKAQQFTNNSSCVIWLLNSASLDLSSAGNYTINCLATRYSDNDNSDLIYQRFGENKVLLRNDASVLNRIGLYDWTGGGAAKIIVTDTWLQDETSLWTALRNSSMVSLYENSGYVDGEATTGVVAATNNSIRIGYSFNGSIDELRLMNTSVNSSHIKATYYSLMQPTSFASVTDVFTTTTTQSKNTGDSFYSSLTGLTANTLYGFRAMGTQTQGTDYGAWLTFTTSATSDGPLSLYAYPDATYIDLSWLKGAGAVNTLVRYNVGSYPSNTADGNLVYNGSASAYTHTGLTSGTTYYYRAWSDDGLGVYSANYSSVMCTTLAGSSEAGATPEAPDMPGNWFGSPDYTNMADAPLYDMWNAVADSMEMPRNSFWMLLTILNIILISFIFFFISKGNLIVAVGASAVCMAAAGAIELISFWYVGIYLIAAIALSYRAVTR